MLLSFQKLSAHLKSVSGADGGRETRHGDKTLRLPFQLLSDVTIRKFVPSPMPSLVLLQNYVTRERFAQLV